MIHFGRKPKEDWFLVSHIKVREGEKESQVSLRPLSSSMKVYGHLVGNLFSVWFSVSDGLAAACVSGTLIKVFQYWVCKMRN